MRVLQDSAVVGLIRNPLCWRNQGQDGRCRSLVQGWSKGGRWWARLRALVIQGVVLRLPWHEYVGVDFEEGSG